MSDPKLKETVARIFRWESAVLRTVAQYCDMKAGEQEEEIARLRGDTPAELAAIAARVRSTRAMVNEALDALRGILSVYLADLPPLATEQHVRRAHAMLKDPVRVFLKEMPPFSGLMWSSERQRRRALAAPENPIA